MPSIQQLFDPAQQEESPADQALQAGVQQAAAEAQARQQASGTTNSLPSTTPALNAAVAANAPKKKSKAKPAAKKTDPKPAAKPSSKGSGSQPKIPGNAGGSPGRAGTGVIEHEPDNAPATGGGKKKGKAAPETATEKYLQAQELIAEENAAIANNPWTLAGNEIAKEDIAGAKQAEQDMGAGAGSLTATVSAQAQQQALADAGVTPGSQAGQWLQGELNQANANDSPLTNAMNAYASAYEKSEPAIAGALQNMGEANAEATSVAPYSDYLNLLPGHLGNAGYLSLTGPQTAGLPPGLSYYLGKAQVSGVGGTSTTPQIPSAGAVLSGGTSSSTPPAVAPAVNPTVPG